MQVWGRESAGQVQGQGLVSVAKAQAWAWAGRTGPAAAHRPLLELQQIQLFPLPLLPLLSLLKVLLLPLLLPLRGPLLPLQHQPVCCYRAKVQGDQARGRGAAAATPAAPGQGLRLRLRRPPLCRLLDGCCLGAMQADYGQGQARGRFQRFWALPQAAASAVGAASAAAAASGPWPQGMYLLLTCCRPRFAAGHAAVAPAAAAPEVHPQPPQQRPQWQAAAALCATLGRSVA